MIKKAMVGVFVANMLIGCGSGSSSSGSSPQEQMSKKDGIFIIFNYPEDVCKSKTLYREMQVLNGVKNVLTQVGSNNVSCAVYNKNQSNCELQNGGFNSSVSCIIGFDEDKTDNINNKLSYDNKAIFTEEIMEKAIIVADN